MNGIKLGAFVAVALLSACGTTIPYNQSEMTPDQLKATARDKNTLASCTKGNSPWGTVVTATINIDKTKDNLPEDITVDGECKIVVKQRAESK